jgi:hypothetical protein
MKVFKVSDLEIKDVTLSPIKKTRSGRNTTYINYNKSPLLIQLPKMFCPFGASTYQKEKLAPDQLPRYTVQLSLDETNDGVKKLRVFLEKLNNMICTYASKNKEVLSLLQVKTKHTKGKSLDEIVEYIEDNKFSSNIRESQNEKYSDTLKLKIPNNMNKKKPDVVVVKKNKTTVDVTFDNIETEIPKLCEMVCLIQVSSIWYINGKFGYTLNLIRLKPFLKETVHSAKFLDEDDEDDEEQEVVEDDEDDEEEEEKEIIPEDSEED